MSHGVKVGVPSLFLALGLIMAMALVNPAPSSASPYDEYKNLNRAERSYCRWVWRWNECDKSKKHGLRALRSAKKKFGGLHNGRGDAYRHCYWSARMTRAMGWNTAKAFGDRHEQTPGQPWIEKSMDLANNHIGRRKGSTAKSMRQARKRCVRATKKGQLVRIKRGALTSTRV